MNETKPGQSSFETWIKDQGGPSSEVDLSVVVPAFNELRRLPPTLIDIIDFLDARRTNYEVIVVDDGSNDDTSGTVRKFERIRPNVRLIRLPANRGKGYAVRFGVLNARGRRIIFADADGSTPFAEMERLWSAIDHGADVAIGSRAMRSSETAVVTRWYRKYLGRSFNLMVNVLLLRDIADTQCGFKMFTDKAARFLFGHQTVDGFSFDVEILYLARKAGLRISEIPVNWEIVAGSKVNLVLDAAKMFCDIMRFPFRHRLVGPHTYQQEIIQGTSVTG